MAQEEYKGLYGLGIRHSRGMLWAHRGNILHMEAPTKGLDLDFYLLTRMSDKAWPSHFGYPKFGVSLSYLNFGKPELTGKAIGILPFIEFRIFHIGKVNFNMRLGTGIGYLTKKWDLKTNNLNKAIGSHFNGNMRAHGTMTFPLPRNLELNLGAGITHYSNGNITLPNLGVNSIEAFAALHWNFKPILKAKLPPRDTSTVLKRHHFEFTPFYATKQANLVFGKRVHVIGTALRYYYRVSTRSQWGGGLEYTFDPGYVYRDNPNDVVEKPNFRNSSEFSVVIGHELLLGKFGFITDIGTYFYTPSELKGPIYQRLGFKYHFADNWIARASIKAHFSRADFFEWGISYTISR